MPLHAACVLALLAAKPGAHDWSSYNNGVLGTRHNAAEKALGKENAGKLVEKWRYPRLDSLTGIGAVHGTPVVVNGHAYFGTATFPAVYKLTPSGKRKWVFTPKAVPKPVAAAGLPDAGFMNSPLVDADTVYI
ncbi:MAG: hypothetical protein K2W96_02290, partial [Gemmataceae bacterium]|nr:hypothetical protein [Gemmataceae bacterium]